MSHNRRPIHQATLDPELIVTSHAAAIVLLLALLWPLSGAHADVAPPPGQTRVQIHHHVSGTDTIPETHTLGLVTTRRSEPDHVELRWTKLQGAVEIPRGYMLVSRYVAFDDAQLVGLAKALIADLPSDDPSRKALEAAGEDGLAARMRETPIAASAERGHVARFLESGGLIASAPLQQRRLVAVDSANKKAESHWKMAGVKDGAIVLAAVGGDGAEAAPGSPGGCGGCTSGTSASPWFFAILPIAAWARRRRHAGLDGW